MRSLTWQQQRHVNQWRRKKKITNSGLGSVGDWKRWRHPALNDTFPTNKWMWLQWNTRRVIYPHSMTQCLLLVSIGRSWEGMGTISISCLSPWCSVKVLRKSNEISLRGGTSAILGHITSSVIIFVAFIHQNPLASTAMRPWLVEISMHNDWPEWPQDVSQFLKIHGRYALQSYRTGCMRQEHCHAYMALKICSHVF